MQLETNPEEIERKEDKKDSLESLETFFKRHDVKDSDVVASKLKDMGVTLARLLTYRENQIEDICTEAGIGIISKADVCQAIRSTPEAFAYKETQKEKTVLRPLILPLNEQKKINQLYEKQQQIKQLKDRMKKATIVLDSKKQQINENLTNLISVIEKFRDTFLQTVDEYVECKKNVISKNIEDLKEKDINIDKWNGQVQQIMNKPNIDTQEWQMEMAQLLKHHQDLIDWKIDSNYFVFDTNINIHCDVDAVLRSLKDHVKIIENYITLDKATAMKDIPTVRITWKDNLHEQWKSKCVFDVEFKPTENEEKKEEKNLKWEKVQQITRQNTQGNVIEINHPSWKESSHTYYLRMRAHYNDIFECTPYSNVISVFIPVPIFASSILTPLEDHRLQLCLPKKKKSKVTLLYRASRDGFSASTFHRLCDYQGPTVTIINSNRYDHVFGGFTNIHWSSTMGYKNDPESFLFLLRSSQLIPIPQKWDIKAGKEKHAVYHYSDYGPTFGYGYDFILYDNCNTDPSNYSKSGTSYNGPTSHGSLAGAYEFTVKDYEVYKVE